MAITRELALEYLAVQARIDYLREELDGLSEERYVLEEKLTDGQASGTYRAHVDGKTLLIFVESEEDPDWARASAVSVDESKEIVL